MEHQRVEVAWREARARQRVDDRQEQRLFRLRSRLERVGEEGRHHLCEVGRADGELRWRLPVERGDVEPRAQRVHLARARRRQGVRAVASDLAIHLAADPFFQSARHRAGERVFQQAPFAGGHPRAFFFSGDLRPDDVAHDRAVDVVAAQAAVGRDREVDHLEAVDRVAVEAGADQAQVARACAVVEHQDVAELVVQDARGVGAVEQVDERRDWFIDEFHPARGQPRRVGGLEGFEAGQRAERRRHRDGDVGAFQVVSRVVFVHCRAQPAEDERGDLAGCFRAGDGRARVDAVGAHVRLDGGEVIVGL